MLPRTIPNNFKPMLHPPKGHILLVDDNAGNVLVASLMLEMLGFTSQEAMNGIEAIRQFENHRYDAILMDLQMPELDGAQTSLAIRKIEQEKKLPHTAIIAVTAHVSAAHRARCLEAGMDDFISKPYSSNELVAKIGQYVGAEK